MLVVDRVMFSQLLFKRDLGQLDLQVVNAGAYLVPPLPPTQWTRTVALEGCRPPASAGPQGHSHWS